MIIPEAPHMGEPPRRAYPQALRKRTMAAIAALLVSLFASLAGVTTTTTAFTNNHAASIFSLSPCGDPPGICP
jgi:hypothetical protein